MSANRSAPARGSPVINAIGKEDRDHAALAALADHEHLWLERESVANVTGADVREFLALAAAIPIPPCGDVLPPGRGEPGLAGMTGRPRPGRKKHWLPRPLSAGLRTRCAEARHDAAGSTCHGSGTTST